MLRRMIGILLRRPSVAGLLVGSAWRFRRRGWYRRPPFLPLPPRDYLAWRMHTAFGEEEAELPPEALERYLRWTRQGGLRAGRTRP